jgi:hypothetical protein
LHKEELQRRKKGGSSFYRRKTRNFSVTVVFGKEPRSKACVIKLKYSLCQEEGRMQISMRNPIENGRRTSLVTTVMYIVRKMGHSFFSL